ncbi:MAG: hypothetical protein ACFFDW_14670 [Candidatus Thorarchaeota archaeon]
MIEKNLILYKMRIIEYIQDEKVVKIFYEKNLNQILEILYEPKTLEDIYDTLIKLQQKKSKKTIYRYILQLKKSGLVIEAGKRVYENFDQQIKNETLFTRVARIFILNGYKIPADSNAIENHLKIIEGIFKKRYTIFNSEENISKNILEILKRKREISEEIVEESINNFADQLPQMEWNTFFYLIDLLSWLELINQQHYSLEYLLNILKKNGINL